MTITEIEHMWKVASNDPNHDYNWNDAVVVAFANLVAQHEREKTVWTQKHWTEYEHKIVAAEREACARIADSWAIGKSYPSTVIAERIRARGQA